MKIKARYFIILSALIFLLGAMAFGLYWLQKNKAPLAQFDGARALQDVKTQVNYGPRIPASPAHDQTIKYIQLELTKAGWTATLLQQNINGHIAYNLLATRSQQEPIILLGAHYDSRLWASHDLDPQKQKLPVPGADDGASGVAVLLEMARSLPSDSVPTALLFIDIEDNGEIPGWDWLLGSRAFANNMTYQPKAVVILDMIGDADLNIYMEKNSDAGLNQQIWKTAQQLGYETSFIPQYKYSMEDDHTPFVEKGLRAVDLIDFDYPYWHTTQDTTDKVSAKSLSIVGKTMLAWIQNYGPCLAEQSCKP